MKEVKLLWDRKLELCRRKAEGWNSKFPRDSRQSTLRIPTAPQRHPRSQQALPWGPLASNLHKRTRGKKNPVAARFLPSPLNGQLGWVALQLGQVSNSKGTTRKVRDRAQSKAQLEMLQPGTFGSLMSGFHPAARDTSVTLPWTWPGTALTLPTPQPQWDTQPAEHNQPKAAWCLCFREVLSLWAWVTHRGKKSEQVKQKNIKMFLQQGFKAGGNHTACLDYTQEGAQRVSGGRSLSSNSTMKAESWARGSFTSLYYSSPGISSFNEINLLFFQRLEEIKTLSMP